MKLLDEIKAKLIQGNPYKIFEKQNSIKTKTMGTPKKLGIIRLK